MKLKLKKISTKSFILIFATINTIAGFMLGAVVTVVSLVTPPDPNSGEIGAWAILIFPIVNGLLGLAGGSFLTWLYNLLAQFFGGIEFEFENLDAS